MAAKSRALCVCLDIGGTKLAVALADRIGKLLWHAQVPTPKGARSGEQLLAALRNLVADAAHQASGRGVVEVVGVGCGGPMTSYGVTVSPLNIPAWRDFPLLSAIESLAEDIFRRTLPVFVDNDAKALALGEGWLGAARGVADYLAMVVSTGIGGGIVLGGRLLDGAEGNAGHIGHVIVEPNGRLCQCGAQGCLEAEASGTAIEAMTQLPAAQAPREVIERTGALVGRAVASTANLLDLRLAVVGGSVALGFGERFFSAAQQELRRCACLRFSKPCRVVPAGLDSSAPLLGAAAVGWRGLDPSSETDPDPRPDRSPEPAIEPGHAAARGQAKVPGDGHPRGDATPGGGHPRGDATPGGGHPRGDATPGDGHPRGDATPGDA